MVPVVGYLINRKTGLEGERGAGYNYIVAGNGVFIEASGNLIGARIPVANLRIRGLADCEPKLVLDFGKIPQALFDLALNTSLTRAEKEVYFAITWQEKYRLFLTEQEPHEASVKYAILDNTVMDIHSHGKISAHFSGTDNSDEQGLKLYTVVGNLDKDPRVSIRAGVYGYFWEMPWTDVFEGTLTNCVDNAVTEEVTTIELPCECEIPENLISRSWWHWIIGR